MQRDNQKRKLTGPRLTGKGQFSSLSVTVLSLLSKPFSSAGSKATPALPPKRESAQRGRKSKTWEKKQKRKTTRKLGVAGEISGADVIHSCVIQLSEVT